MGYVDLLVFLTHLNAKLKMCVLYQIPVVYIITGNNNLI